MSAKKRILFIVNPTAGTRKAIPIQALIDKHLDRDIFDASVHLSTCRGDAAEQSKQAVSLGTDIVVAVGGDGTVNEAAQGLVHSDTALAVIPRGSGNGFASHLRIPRDPAAAIQLINRCNFQRIDTGLFNDRLFLNVAGLGFDARVVSAFDVFGKRGLLSYLYISLREYFRFNPKHYKLELDNQTIEGEAFLLTAANSSQFGNHACIAPRAKMDDGKLDLVIVKPAAGVPAALGISYRLFNGTLDKSKYCNTYKTALLTIAHSDTEAQIDGEPIQTAGKSTIKVQPASLLVVS